MDFQFIKNFFSSYGLPTIIVSAVCLALCYLLKLLLKDKLNVFLKTQIPFAIAIILQFAYDMIFVSRSFTFTESAFTAGILSGSLTIIFNSVITKISQGKFIGVSATVLLIEGLLDGIIPASCLVATAIAVENIIVDGATEQEDEQLVNQIVDILKLNSDKELTKTELIQKAKMIISAVCSL